MTGVKDGDNHHHAVTGDPMSTDKYIAVTFLHPRDGQQFEAEVTPQTTGQAALDGLIRTGFLEDVGAKGAYALQHQRRKCTLPLSSSLMGEGVEAKDTIAVILTNAGAGH
jgi:hypothetical protein